MTSTTSRGSLLEHIEGLVYQLEDEDSRCRLDTLQKLRKIAKTSGEQFQVRNLRRFFNCVRRRINDEDKEVSIESLRLVCDIVPIIGQDIDLLLSIIIPHVIPLLPEEPLARKDNLNEAMSVLLTYLQYSKNMSGLINALMNVGMNHSLETVREASILALKDILQEHKQQKEECMDINFSRLLEALVSLLEDEDAPVVVAAEETIAVFKVICDDFDFLAKRLSQRDRVILNDHLEYITKFIPSPRKSEEENAEETVNQRFGYLPEAIAYDLADTSAYGAKQRSAAMKSFLDLTQALTEKQVVHVTKHLSDLFHVLQGLLEDPNVKIVFTSLEIVHALVMKITSSIQPYLPDFVPILVEKLGDAKLVIRQASFKVFTALMLTFSNASMYLSLRATFEHTNCQVREEGVKVLMFSLLKRSQQPLPMNEFLPDLGDLLMDPQVRVRNAALELCAILEHVVGLNVIHELEKNESLHEHYDIRELQNRLASKTVACTNEEGMIEYRDASTTFNEQDSTRDSLKKSRDVEERALKEKKEAFHSFHSRGKKRESSDDDKQVLDNRSTLKYGYEKSDDDREERRHPAPTEIRQSYKQPLKVEIRGSNFEETLIKDKNDSPPAHRSSHFNEKEENKEEDEEEKDEEEDEEEDEEAEDDEGVQGDEEDEGEMQKDEEEEELEKEDESYEGEEEEEVDNDKEEEVDNDEEDEEAKDEKEEEQEKEKEKAMNGTTEQKTFLSTRRQSSPHRYEPLLVPEQKREPTGTSQQASFTGRLEEDKVDLWLPNRRKSENLSSSQSVPTRTKVDDPPAHFMTRTEKGTLSFQEETQISARTPRKRLDDESTMAKKIITFATSHVPATTATSTFLTTAKSVEENSPATSQGHRSFTNPLRRRRSPYQQDDRHSSRGTSDDSLSSFDHLRGLEEDELYHHTHTDTHEHKHEHDDDVDVDLDEEPTTLKSQRTKMSMEEDKTCLSSSPSSHDVSAKHISSKLLALKQRRETKRGQRRAISADPVIHFSASSSSPSFRTSTAHQPTFDAAFSSSSSLTLPPTTLEDSSYGSRNSGTMNGGGDRTVAVTPVEHGVYDLHGARRHIYEKRMDGQRCVEVSGEDRPIRPMPTSFQNQVFGLSTNAVVREALETPPKRIMSAVALESEDRNVFASASSASSASPGVVKKMTLATRKRLEAKQKEEEEESGRDGEVKDDFSSSSSGKKSPRRPLFTKERDVPSSTSPVKRSGGKTSFMDSPKASDSTAVYLERHELNPVSNPKLELSRLTNSLLKSSDWEETFKALNTVRALAIHHASFLEEHVHEVTKHVLKEVNNLRSSVAKNALLTLETMFTELQRAMDAELDELLPIVMKRVADTNVFLNQAAVSVIQVIAAKASIQRALPGFLTSAQSKTGNIRTKSAEALDLLIRNNAGKFAASRDCDRALTALGKMLVDSTASVRTSAKQTVHFLITSGIVDLTRLKRCLGSQAYERVEQLVSQGPSSFSSSSFASVPNASSSFASSSSSLAAHPSLHVLHSPEPKATAVLEKTRSFTKPRNSSSSSSSSSGGATPNLMKSSTRPTSTSSTITPPSHALPGLEKILSVLEKRLGSSDWKERLEALHELKDWMVASPDTLLKSGKITLVFDHWNARLEDGNTKVNLYALEALQDVIPALGDGIEPVLATFVPILCGNLAASNKQIQTLADVAVDALCEHVSSKYLCQSFSTIIRHGNSRIKARLLVKLVGILAAAYEERPSCVTKYVLAVALELMEENKTDIRDANNQVLRRIYSLMGNAMLVPLSEAQQDRLMPILRI